MAVNPSPTRPAWFNGAFGLRAVLILIAIVLYIIYLFSSHNDNLLAYAGIATAIAVVVP